MSRPRTILLVDDDPNVLALLQASLRLKGYLAESYRDPADALVYLKNHVPDLLICDTTLPHIDGFDFIRRVQGTTRAAYTPFIFVGGDSNPETAARGLRMGAREYLRKPFTVDELLVRVEKVFLAVDSARTATPRHDLEGSLEHFPFPELLRFLQAGRRTGRLTITLPFEPVEGILYLREGETVHAVFGRLKGRAAMLQLVLDGEGAFAFTASDEPDSPVVTVSQPLQEILADGRALMEAGMLRRIDVLNRPACRTFVRLIESGGEGEVILLTDRIAPVILEQTVTGEIDDSELPPDSSGEWAEPIEDSLEHVSSERFSSSDSLVFEAEEGYVTDSTILVPANTLFPTDDRLNVSGELFDDEDGATRSIVVPSYRPEDDYDEEIRSSDDPGRPSMDVEIVESGPGPLERTFDALQKAFMQDNAFLGVRNFQISTRSGRCLASTVSRQDRREMIAAFTAHAIQFADATEQGLFAQLAAGDLQVLVTELPRRRLLTSLFDAPPDLDAFRKIAADATAEAD